MLYYPYFSFTAYKKLAISTAEAENSNFHELAVSHCEINKFCSRILHTSFGCSRVLLLLNF